MQMMVRSGGLPEVTEEPENAKVEGSELHLLLQYWLQCKGVMGVVTQIHGGNFVIWAERL